MKVDHLGQIVYNEEDCINLLMSGNKNLPAGLLVDNSVRLNRAAELFEDIPDVIVYDQEAAENISITDFDLDNQSDWYMPDSYKNLDIAEYILGLCQTQDELQRVGDELLLYQERNLFNLLRYLKYLVDTMTQHHLIWGVGRGSSVASYVLYLLGVHKINSLYYNLDIREFLR